MSVSTRIRGCCLLVVSTLLSWPCLASTDLAKTHPVSENVRGHENIEWSIGYAFHLTDEKKELPRVLLVGDSICNGYQGEVQKRLEGKMNVSYWVSSYCVTSPGYLKLLDFYLSEADYDVISFNNGCHSFSTPVEDWKKGLRAALRLIRERKPQAKIVWSNTTPNRKAKYDEAVARLNAAALPVIAEIGGIRTNDLYSAMDSLDATHQSKEYWNDDYHFTPAAIRVQAGIVADACCAALERTADEPWLIVNEDNDHYFKNPSELMTEKALVDYVDYTCQGKVTHFFMCPSGQRASFDSKTWEPIWKGIGEAARPDTATGPNGTRDRWCVNAKLLCDKGIDPYTVWTKRCRERDVSPWMTLRMNDVHHMDNTNYFRNTTFCKTRRDLWLRPDAKGWTDFCLDYAKKDTQDYMMAHLVEVAERYDVDGIELDWMRAGVNLRRGHEREDAHRMTAFMRDVRRRLDDIGTKRGRRIALGIRACYDPDLALDRMGMDVAAWAKEGLVDLVVPTGIYFADAGIAVSKWVERIGRANPRVRVIPCIDYCHRQKGQRVWMNMAKFRWVANRHYAQGATGIYLFNVPYIGKYPTDGKCVPNDVAAEIFTEGLTPESVRGKPQEPIEVFHDFP